MFPVNIAQFRYRNFILPQFSHTLFHDRRRFIHEANQSINTSIIRNDATAIAAAAAAAVYVAMDTGYELRGDFTDTKEAFDVHVDKPFYLCQ